MPRAYPQPAIGCDDSQPRRASNAPLFSAGVANEKKLFFFGVILFGRGMASSVEVADGSWRDVDNVAHKI